MTKTGKREIEQPPSNAIEIQKKEKLYAYLENLIDWRWRTRSEHEINVHCVHKDVFYVDA